MHSGAFVTVTGTVISSYFVNIFVKQNQTHVSTWPLNPHTDPLSRVETQFFAELLPRQNFYHSVISPPTSARAPADAEIFLLRLSHKDGIKKVENTSALAFPLQAEQTKAKWGWVNMQLIEVDIRVLRHELHIFSSEQKGFSGRRCISPTSLTNICDSMRSHWNSPPVTRLWLQVLQFHQLIWEKEMFIWRQLLS